MKIQSSQWLQALGPFHLFIGNDRVVVSLLRDTFQYQGKGVFHISRIHSKFLDKRCHDSWYSLTAIIELESYLLIWLWRCSGGRGITKTFRCNPVVVSYYELEFFFREKGERRKPSTHENFLPQLPDLHRCEQASLCLCLHSQEQLKMPQLPHHDRQQPEAASPKKPFLLKLLPVQYMVQTYQFPSHQYPQLLSFSRLSKKKSNCTITSFCVFSWNWQKF